MRSILNTELNGHKTPRLANTANLTFHSPESEGLLILLDKEAICAPSGSTCLADSDEPSQVIKAMKLDSTASPQMIWFSLDKANSPADIGVVFNGVQRTTELLRT
ncbi:MAG: aminotransferase class V-fold PLP-dependent enzyme [Terriglobia bacterium]